MGRLQKFSSVCCAVNPAVGREVAYAVGRAQERKKVLVVGGGAKGALWCQMMADVYNARIKVPVLLEEATSMCAAVTGGVGVGVFKGFEVIDQMLELNRTVEPDPEAVAAYGPVKEAFEVCYKAMLPVYEYMASHKNA